MEGGEHRLHRRSTDSTEGELTRIYRMDRMMLDGWTSGFSRQPVRRSLEFVEGRRRMNADKLSNRPIN